MESNYIQANLINKASDEICSILYDKEIQSKLGFLLCSNHELVSRKLKDIEAMQRIIDGHTRLGNFKRALIFCCLLKRSVKELVQMVQNTKVKL